MPLLGVRQVLAVRWMRETCSLDALVSAPWAWLGGGSPLHTAEVTGSILVAPTTNPQLRGYASIARTPLPVRRGNGVVTDLDRSEEHTSELQSRENLVC